MSLQLNQAWVFLLLFVRQPGGADIQYGTTIEESPCLSPCLRIPIVSTATA